MTEAKFKAKIATYVRAIPIDPPFHVERIEDKSTHGIPDTVILKRITSWWEFKRYEISGKRNQRENIKNMRASYSNVFYVVFDVGLEHEIHVVDPKDVNSKTGAYEEVNWIGKYPLDLVEYIKEIHGV